MYVISIPSMGLKLMTLTEIKSRMSTNWARKVSLLYFYLYLCFYFLNYVCVCVFKIFIYLFWEREWIGERSRETESQAGSVLSVQGPTRGSISGTAGSWPEQKSRLGHFDLATQAPLIFLMFIYLFWGHFVNYFL